MAIYVTAHNLLDVLRIDICGPNTPTNELSTAGFYRKLIDPQINHSINKWPNGQLASLIDLPDDYVDYRHIYLCICLNKNIALGRTRRQP